MGSRIRLAAGCPASVPHPGAQLGDVDHSACARRRSTGGDGPSLNGPPDTPNGASGGCSSCWGRNAFAGHSTQETEGRPGLARPWISPLKRIARGRFTAQAGSPPTRTNQTQLTHPHGTPLEIGPGRPHDYGKHSRVNG